MLENLTFIDKNCFFDIKNGSLLPAYDMLGQATTCRDTGSAMSAISMAVCIIPNLLKMFNENITFLKKFRE
jgi:hypothetical protein